MKKREFKVVKTGEPLKEGVHYYYASWKMLPESLLESRPRELLHYTGLVNIVEGEPEYEDVSSIILEEYPVGKAPGEEKYSLRLDSKTILTLVV